MKIEKSLMTSNCLPTVLDSVFVTQAERRIGSFRTQQSFFSDRCHLESWHLKEIGSSEILHIYLYRWLIGTFKWGVQFTKTNPQDNYKTTNV